MKTRKSDLQKPIQRQKTRTAKMMMVGSLEFVVGVIFVFGVAALFYFSTKRTLDTILGGIHMGFGVATFPVVYGVLKARSLGDVLPQLP
jgi:Na+/proline symporter